MGIAGRMGLSGLAVLIGLALAPAAGAQEPTKLTQGTATLPTSGLVIDLPVKQGIVYHVSGSWGLSDDEVFDTRDVVDEIDAATGNVKLGNWVLMGYFNAGGCDDTLQDTQLDAAWTQEASLWGESWKARGGVFTFDGPLGRRPALMLCREEADGFALLLYHFLADQPESTGRDLVMASARASEALASASRSFSARRFASIQPLLRTDVRNRGDNPAARIVTLARAGLKVALPSDGYLWLVSEDENVDYLDRLLPTLPPVSLEIVLRSETTCTEIFNGLSGDMLISHTPTNLPAGWTAGPALLIDDTKELTMCRDLSGKALAVGVFQEADNRDVSQLAPILGALRSAAESQ